MIDACAYVFNSAEDGGDRLRRRRGSFPRRAMPTVGLFANNCDSELYLDAAAHVRGSGRRSSTAPPARRSSSIIRSSLRAREIIDGASTLPRSRVRPFPTSGEQAAFKYTLGDPDRGAQTFPDNESCVFRGLGARNLYAYRGREGAGRGRLHREIIFSERIADSRGPIICARGISRCRALARASSTNPRGILA